MLTGVVNQWRTSLQRCPQELEQVSEWQNSCLHPAEVKGELISAFVLN